MPKLYVLALCIQNNHVLLMRRIRCSFGQGLFSLPGGKVEDCENCMDALVRELHEELGIHVNPDHIAYVHTLHRCAEQDVIVAVSFKVTAWSGDIHNCEPLKHADLTWFPLTNIPADILPGHRCVLEAVASGQCFSEQGWT